MPTPFHGLDRMLAAWNTSDPEEARNHVEAALEHNIHFVDPNYNIIGREAFLDMVRRVKAEVPGAVFSRASRIDEHNNHCRYHWAVHIGGELVLRGFDVAEINEAGRVVKVTGFFGELELDPAAAP